MIKKTIIYLVTFLLFFMGSDKQIKSQENNQINSMLNYCFYEIINNIKNYYNTYFEDADSMFSSLFIFTDNLPIDFEFSKEIKSMNVKMTGMTELTQEQKLKGIKGVSFVRMILNSDSLTFVFVKKDAILKNNIFEIGLSASYRYSYKYSCLSDNWKLISDNQHK